MSAEKPAASQTVSSLLLGLAVGDALGVPVEFRPRGSFHCRSMTGYGAHNQPPGTWSDGTPLTLCLAGSLSRGLNLEDIARSFIKRHGEAPFTARGAGFDSGISAAEAVRRLKEGAAPEKAGRAGADENGNGSLMRTAPPAFFPAGKPEAERFEITRAVSSITRARAPGLPPPVLFTLNTCSNCPAAWRSKPPTLNCAARLQGRQFRCRPGHACRVLPDFTGGYKRPAGILRQERRLCYSYPGGRLLVFPHCG